MNEESIFIEALALSGAAERAAYLDRACAANPALRANVESLLAAHGSENLLDRPVARFPSFATRDWRNAGPKSLALPPPIDGEVIADRYILERPLGEGGMGMVFQARQIHPVQRDVALKVIRPGMNSDRVLLRFDAERQALAVLDHPGIAKVLDAGTTADGRPFFAMELVPGQPLAAYCDEHRLTIRERLDVFLRIGRAVQHAHQKGIIHRDLKPGNILVAEQDGRAIPKVIDFGLAKALSAGVLPGVTQEGLPSLVGTPLYMAPEQAESNGDVDTRADIFALGAILYELLIGRTPLDGAALRSANALEQIRLVRNTDLPTPSKLLESSAELSERSSLARRIDPERLKRTVRGELEWIAMKCLEKERDRRYATVGDLIEDVRRYLAEEPVLAGPPSRWYARRKFLRRNRVVVAASIAAVGALAAGLALAMVGLFEARAQERIADGERLKANAAAEKAIAEAGRANREAETADEVSAFLVGLFESRDRLAITAANLQFRDRAANSVRASDLLARGVAQLQSPEGLKRSPLVRARLLHEIAAIQFSLGESAAARPLAAEALALREKHLAPDDPSTIKTLLLSAQLEYLEGEYTTCHAIHQDAIARLVRSESTKPLDLAETEVSFGVMLSESDPAESARLLGRGYEAYKKHAGANDFRTISAGWALAFIGVHGGDFARSIPLATELLAQIETSEADPELKSAVRLALQLVVADAVGSDERHIEMFRKTVAQLAKVFGRGHPITNRARRRMAGLIYDAAPAYPNPAPLGSRPVNIRPIFDDYKAGRVPKLPAKPIHGLHEAAILYAEAVTTGPRWERTINRFNLGRAFMRCRLYPEADALLTESLDEFRKLPPEVGRFHYPHNLQLVAWLRANGGTPPDEVEKLLREAESFAREHGEIVRAGRRIETLMDLGRYRLNRDAPAEAATLFVEAIAMVNREHGADSARALRARAFHYSALRAAGQAAESEAARRDLETRLEKFKDSSAPEVANARTLLSGQRVPWP